MLPLLKTMIRQNKYKLYERPYELNIVGIRSDSVLSNRFDDKLYVFFNDKKSKWQLQEFSITTDPGTFWLENPLNEQGTAILAPAQYVDTYSIGLHRGKYEALVQVAPVKIWRDYDRNAILDFSNGVEISGLLGINIHHASAYGTTKTIDRYSAGCQVFENIDDFTRFMQMCYQHRDLYGNHFTYTLFDFRSQARTRKRYFAYGIGVMAFASLALGSYAIYDYYNEKQTAVKP
jgi:hypothetical protein